MAAQSNVTHVPLALNTPLGIAASDKVSLQNQGKVPIYIAVETAAPADNTEPGIRIDPGQIYSLTLPSAGVLYGWTKSSLFTESTIVALETG